MARVRGIVAAGLQAANAPRAEAARAPGGNQEAQERHERDAEAIKARVQGRLGRASATRTSDETTDTLGSLVGGLGAASVFGGPAGLLVFGVSKFLQNKRRQGIAAFQTQAAESSEAFIERSEAALQQFEANASNDQERAEAKMMRAQWDQTKPLMSHPSPEVASRAMIAGLDMLGTLDAELDDWQGERLEAEQRERDQLTAEISRADGIRDDVQREGGEHVTREDAYQRMLAVDDTAAGDQVLVVNAFKMVDPNSAVLPGEAATAANAAGVPDVLVTLYNRILRDGERLSPDQRADLIRQAGIQYQVSRANQIDRNTSALERARAQGVRGELLPHITLPVKSPDELPFPTGQLLDETSARAMAGPVTSGEGVNEFDAVAEAMRSDGPRVGADGKPLGPVGSFFQEMLDRQNAKPDFWERREARHAEREAAEAAESSARLLQGTPTQPIRRRVNE